MLRLNSEKGNTTLEVILSLILFSFVAMSISIALPMAYDNANDWRDRMNLARYLEGHLEERRSQKYDSLTISDTGYVEEVMSHGINYQYRYLTTFATEGLDINGNPTWVSLPSNSGNGILGTYYNNPDFSGTFVTRIDPQINFNWGANAPHPAIDADTFSIRWRGYVEPRYSETYTFYTSSDDGVRLWVNGILIIDNWTLHSATENSGTINLLAGQRYPIIMEFYENTDVSVAELSWSSPSTPKQIIPQENLFLELPKMTTVYVRNPKTNRNISGMMLTFPDFQSPQLPETFGGLAGLYFNNLDFSGASICRIDPEVNFDWDANAPANTIDPHTFSTRWTGFVIPQYSGYYTFYTQSDDGVRLWVNHQLLIDHWNDHTRYEDTGTPAIYLQANQKYPVTMDFYENYGVAVAQLLWSGPSVAKQVIPRSRLLPTYSSFEDAYVDQRNPNINYGDNQSLNVNRQGNERYSYLKFNVAGITGKNIQSIKLMLYANNNGKTDFEVRKTTSIWNESTITWNNRPTVGTTVYGNYTQDVSSNSFVEIDLDPTILDHGDGVYELALIPIGGNNDISFYSRNYSNHDLGPRLILEFATEDNNPNTDLLLQYRCNFTNNSSNTLGPWFKIQNNGSEPVNLANVKIRYWYTIDTNLTQNFTCDWAGLTKGYSMINITSKITRNIVQLSSPVNGADYYVEIGFAADAGILDPGKTVELQSRIYNSNWINYNQTNDYSFVPSLSAYGENTKITGYINGVLFSGVEPH